MTTQDYFVLAAGVIALGVFVFALDWFGTP